MNSVSPCQLEPFSSAKPIAVPNPLDGGNDVAASDLWKVERSEVGKTAASDGEAGKVRAVLGMRRRYTEGRLKRVRARQDYGAVGVCKTVRSAPFLTLLAPVTLLMKSARSGAVGPHQDREHGQVSRYRGG